MTLVRVEAGIEATWVWRTILWLSWSVASQLRSRRSGLGSLDDLRAKQIRALDENNVLSQWYALVLIRGCLHQPQQFGRGLLQYWQGVMRKPEGLHAAIQFHVRCNLRAFRLTKSITQSCGACASHPHNTHCAFFGGTKYTLANMWEKTWLCISYVSNF